MLILMYLMGIVQILKNCWLNKVNIFLYFISKARTLNLNRTVMGMEDETRDFLVRIINTIAIVLIILTRKSLVSSSIPITVRFKFKVRALLIK